MRFFKVFLSILFAFLLSINANAETIIFPAGVYEGEIDSKGRAHGEGRFKFDINFLPGKDSHKVLALNINEGKKIKIDPGKDSYKPSLAITINEGKKIKIDDVVYIGNFHNNITYIERT